MVEGARLESVYTETYRGFESLLLRQITKQAILWGGLFRYGVRGSNPTEGSTRAEGEGTSARSDDGPQGEVILLLRQIKKPPKGGFFMHASLRSRYGS